MKYKLADLLTIYNGCDHKHLGTGDIPVYGSGGIMRYVDSALSHGPSILLPRKGTIDNIQYVEGPFWSVDTAYYTKINTEIANPYYLYCYLCSLDLSGLVSGTGLPSMTFDSYYHVVVDLPQIDCQNKVANCLMNLDRKIALNRKINTELEQMAKELYDYWFVQFDFPNAEGKPYKSSGGKMVYNPQLKRDIPEGWEVKKIENLGSLKNGINYDKDEIGDTTFRIVNVRNISSSTLFIDESDIDEISLVGKKATPYLVKDGDIIIARSGNPGATRLCSQESGTIIYCGFIICLSPNDKNLTNYLALFLTNREKAIKKLIGGSIMPNISQDSLKPIDVIVPSQDTLLSFNTIINTLFCKLKNSLKETSTLLSLRNQLLPLLMNGQVTIK